MGTVTGYCYLFGVPIRIWSERAADQDREEPEEGRPGTPREAPRLAGRSSPA